jgi:hypothetical protein
VSIITVRRRRRDFAFQEISNPNAGQPGSKPIEMRQHTIVQSDHGSRSAGTLPVARREMCVREPLGDVRPYAPFGLFNGIGQHAADAPKVPEGTSRQISIEKEQRGRTGLAA